MRRMSTPDEEPSEPTMPGEGKEPAGDAADAVPDDESAWELPEAVPSSWVAFWPHADPPSREEVGRAVASWVGRELEAEAADADEGSDALWTLVVRVPGVTTPVALWAEPAIPADPGQLPDSAMARCKWVVGMQALLELGEAHEEYFHLVAMLFGSLPELVGVLDVSNSRRWTRAEVEEQFLAQDAVPNDEFLWTITAVATSEDEDAPMLLFTTGLDRCGLPELELLELPARHSQAGAILLNHVASLLLEAPPPAPRTPIEVGPGLSVALVPWQDCSRFVPEGQPGSVAFREEAARHGDGALAGVRAVVCGPEPRGQYRQIWTWPREIIERMEDGRAVLYASEHSAAANERRAQRAWPKFATAYASLRRADAEATRALAETAFHVQAPVGGVDAEDRREQGWFIVRRFDHDVVEAALSEEPVTRDDLHAGDVVRIERKDVSDWRVILPDDTFGPDRGDALLSAVDRLRGLA